MTVPRLLFESAMNAQVRTDTEWKGAVAELFAIRRLMATVANNVNQIAKFANAEGRFVEEAREVVAEHRSIVTRMNAVLDRLAGR
ncbi:plasmid mobilization relaxosome protein MobC [Microbacteriaceae bacterium VKM Ac-2855]|nr:plasmid mobilization relaxosome protein MobC [Microbacteriaceae bacterium VKM Ac-2855]